MLQCPECGSKARQHAERFLRQNEHIHRQWFKHTAQNELLKESGGAESSSGLVSYAAQETTEDCTAERLIKKGSRHT